MDADRIREFCQESVESTRRRGGSQFAFNADGIRDVLRWQGWNVETSEVVAALSDPAFESLCGVKLLEVKVTNATLTSVHFRLLDPAG